jgi:hypothetical protein
VRRLRLAAASEAERLLRVLFLRVGSLPAASTTATLLQLIATRANFSINAAHCQPRVAERPCADQEVIAVGMTEYLDHLWLPKIVSGMAQIPRWAILALGCLTS